MIRSLKYEEKHKSFLSSRQLYHLTQPQNTRWKAGHLTAYFLFNQLWATTPGAQKRAMRKKAQESDLGFMKSSECSGLSARHSPLRKQQVCLPVLEGTSHWQYALFFPQQWCFRYYEFQYLPSWWGQGWLQPEVAGILAEVHDLGQTPREQRI